MEDDNFEPKPSGGSARESLAHRALRRVTDAGPYGGLQIPTPLGRGFTTTGFTESALGRRETKRDY